MKRSSIESVMIELIVTSESTQSTENIVGSLTIEEAISMDRFSGQVGLLPARLRQGRPHLCCAGGDGVV